MSGKSSIRVSRKDRIFYAIVNFILLLVLLAVVLPLMNVISSSVSDVKQVMQGKVFLLPKHFSLDGYKAVFQSDSIITGYANTIFYSQNRQAGGCFPDGAFRPPVPPAF